MHVRLRRKGWKVVHTPGGRYVVHRVKHKRKVDYCGICGKPLHGSRRNRAFGNFCASCARELLRMKVMKYVVQ